MQSTHKAVSRIDPELLRLLERLNRKQLQVITLAAKVFSGEPFSEEDRQFCAERPDRPYADAAATE